MKYLTLQASKRLNTLNICQGKDAQRANVDKLIQDNDKIALKWKEEIEIHLARAPTVMDPQLRMSKNKGDVSIMSFEKSLLFIFFAFS